MNLKTHIFTLYFIVVLITGCDSTPQRNQLSALSQKMAANQQSTVTTGESIASQNQIDRKSDSGVSLMNVNFDACALITKAEIKTVQGETVKEAKSSSRVSGALIVSQCFYQLTTYSKSVSLQITQSNPDNPEKYNLRDYWKEKFNVRTAVDNDREDENDGKRTPEKKADGRQGSNQLPSIRKLGDEAFLTGNRITGALYVLKKNAIIRISIGGADSDAARIKKLKILAQKALKRI